MRTLLEIHYDDLHYERYMKKAETPKTKRGNRKTRLSEFKVFKSVVNNIKQQRCQRIQLPNEVKGLLKSPKDETNWDVLEKLREIVLLFVQGL